ncbi:exodeoxyribonuclease III [Methanocella sp. CWC-04]|uniref:Exodeoxyribonuclease III n=1 Tax=Methanooceanicella nereidis TaxID=2052831 RepID=A0AAP2W4P9_9EURY|nr:exodeoxyribonuclease III [Methanocella sp. CWC-04]MCD1294570.1 exodeoxyribonuclease III [Methanocella sp. CWC-04]
MRLLSWNVNGIRAVLKKGTLQQLMAKSPDILCIQETKAVEEQVPEDIKYHNGYHAYFSSAVKKGYSGVALFTKEKPLSVWHGFGIKRFDDEGRAIIADYGRFILMNIYFPNGKMSKERLDYKMDFYEAFLEYADGLKAEGKNIVVCGDLNTAHMDIDLARPKENEKTSGFLPGERAWIDKFVSHGYIDTFRVFNKDPGHYSYWDMKTRARERNVGWRIDYFFIDEGLIRDLASAFLMPEIPGSDHCPAGIDIKF